MSVTSPERKAEHPEVSLVLPCYNEEESIGETIPELCRVFREAQVRLEVVAVDNGSRDRTGEIIDRLVAGGLPVQKVPLKVNQGYGGGILEGLDACTAPVIGYLCADGQVAAEDALMAYQLILGRENRIISKVRRRFRKDSWKRKIVSILYNGLMQVVYGRLGAIDINGSPKIFSREVYGKLRLQSRDWFLDPEIIIKAKRLGLRVIEVDVEGFARRGGASNVKVQTCAEFLGNIVRYRLGGELRSWARSIPRIPEAGTEAAPGSRSAAVSPGPPGFGNSPLKEVRVLDQQRFHDGRGYLHKVLSATQCDGRTPAGEVYVVAANPGEARGNHYHLNMGEWFSVVQGAGELRLCNLQTRERKTITVDSAKPCTVYVSAGVAHSIVNKTDELMICVAWAEKEHDPADVYAFNL